MRYSLLLGNQALAAVHRALAGHGTVDVVRDARELLAELEFPRDECVVLDPALVSRTAAESIAARVARYPRALVAYSSVTESAIESAVVLAQHTRARFVFRGESDEYSALQHALLLTPNSELGSTLLVALEAQLKQLPVGLRERIVFMFQSGDGPGSPDALATASGITRRSLDRRICEAGLVSARALVEAAHFAWAYRAITSSKVPLGRIAAMLGYTSRTMDQQLRRLANITSSKLRENPLTIVDASNRLAQHLIVPANANTGRDSAPPPSADTKASLKLMNGGARRRRGARIIPPETRANP